MLDDVREGATPPVPFTYPTDFNDRQLDDLLRHVRSAVERDWPTIVKAPERPDEIAIVGGGPSLVRYLDELRAFKGAILCVNHTVKFLKENGITPWGCVFSEIRSWKPYFLDEIYDDVWYLPASQCHPDTLDMLSGHPKVMLWHAVQHSGEEKIVWGKLPGAVMIGGGNSVYTRAINIAHIMGFRGFRLFGCDSSFEDKTHVYHDRPEDEIEILAAGKRFKTTSRLAMQADWLRWYTRTFAPLMGFRCHADGLFPHIHRTMFPTIYEAA